MKSKMKLRTLVTIVVVLAMLTTAAYAAGTIGRFSPTHKIVQPVNCASCHPEELAELTETTHIYNFARELSRVAAVSGMTDENASSMDLDEAPYFVSGGCTMCHNNWDNRERFGLGDYYTKFDTNSGIYVTKNAQILPWSAGLGDDNKFDDNNNETGNISITLTNLNVSEIDATVKVYLQNWTGLNPQEPLDLYNVTNATITGLNVSGTSIVTIETEEVYGDYFRVEITNNGAGNVTARIASLYGATSYKEAKKTAATSNFYDTSATSAAGVDISNLIANGTTVNTDDLISGIAGSKSTTEFALHTTWLYSATRLDAVWGDWSGISPAPMQYISTFGRARPDRDTAPDGYDRITSCDNAANGMCHITLATAGLSMEHSEWKPELPGTPYEGSNLGGTTYFTHDMKLTTTDYASKPVRLCGACHITQMPPMEDDGTPIGDIDLAPIDIRMYGDDGTVIYLNGKTAKASKLDLGDANINVTYHSPTSWAHQTVPCIRCHSHAGIGAGVEVGDEDTAVIG